MKRKNYPWNLPEAIEERLGNRTFGHQRNIWEDGHLLIILHEPPAIDQMIRDHRVFYRPPVGDLQCNGRSNGKRQLPDLLQQYQDTFERLEDMANEARKARAYFQVLEELIPLSSAIKGLAKTLSEARKLVPKDDFILEMRDWSSDLDRNFETLLQDSRLALEFQTAQKAEEQVHKTEHALHAQNRLNTIAAFTFPVMAVATVLGMNLKHGLENQDKTLFWIVLVVGIGIGFWVQRWMFKGQGDRS